jgi:ADP-ribose pyrophosphatase
MGYAENPWLLETVGGYCEEGEQPEDVARRETLEETGCELLNLEFIGKFFTTPGWTSERVSLYCGQVDSRNAQGIHGLDEEGEDIRVEVMTLEEAVVQLFQRANSTSIIISLQWLLLNRDDVHRRWCH